MTPERSGTTDASFVLALRHASGVRSFLSASKLNHLQVRELRAYGDEGSYVSSGTDVQAQAIFAKHHYRPIKREAAKKEDLALLPEIKLFKIEDYQGGWDDIQKKNFDNGGLFDQLGKASH